MRDFGGLVLLALLGVGACTTEKGPVGGDPGDDDDDAPLEPECTIDDDCGSIEICVDELCEVGDRDNAFDEATPIFQNEVRSGVIAPAGDVDTYAYTSLGPEWLRIETTTAGDPVDSLDTVVQVFAANGGEHAVMDNFPTGRVSTYDTVLYVYLPRADTWYVTVEDVTTHYTSIFTEDEHRGGSGFTYDLQLRPSTGTTGEPDALDDASQTVEITSGSSIWSVGVNLETPGDADYITVDLPYDGRPLDVFGHSSIPGSPARARVRLYDPSGQVVVDKHDLGDEGQASYFDPVAGLYTLEATDVDGGGSADHWYVVYVRTYEEDDSHPFFGSSEYEYEYEPNDLRPDATGMTLVQATTSSGSSYHVQYVEGRLDDATDEDWWIVSTAPDELVSVRCFAESFGSLAEVQVALYDGTADITPGSQGLTPTLYWYYVHNVAVPDPDDYHVRISAVNGAFGLGAYYRCQILQAPFELLVE